MKFSTVSPLLLSAASLVSSQDTLPTPTKFAIALFPGFQAIDAFGPLDILNILSWRTYLNLTILYDTLTPIGTSSHAPPHNRSSSTFEQFIVPTHTFDTAPSDIEVLIVPGGLGNRLPSANGVVDFIKSRYPKLRYLITVCTGSGLAARAGVLDGKRATTNKWAFGETSKLSNTTHWVSHARWVVDGNIWTSSGVSAGIDVMLAWVSYMYGYATAKELADGAEYEWHQDPDWDPFSLRWPHGDVVNGTTLENTATASPTPPSSGTPPVVTVTSTQTLVVTSVSTSAFYPVTSKTTTGKTTKTTKTTSAKTTKKIVTTTRRWYDAHGYAA